MNPVVLRQAMHIQRLSLPGTLGKAQFLLNGCGTSLPIRAWLGLAWLGLAWLGLAWLGLAWLGLAWLGKVCACYRFHQPSSFMTFEWRKG